MQCHPVHQRLCVHSGSGHTPGLRVRSWLGRVQRGNQLMLHSHTDVSLSQKINEHISSSEDFKNILKCLVQSLAFPIHNRMSSANSNSFTCSFLIYALYFSCLTAPSTTSINMLNKVLKRGHTVLPQIIEGKLSAFYH